ncbi:MAG TPA: D-2-hydroxyacid dehydrogenase [Anaerolineaceae bacterium]
MNTSAVEVLITVPFSESILDDLNTISPRLHIVSQAAKRPEDISAETWQKTEILYTDQVLPNPAQVPNLRWVQFHYAGIDYALEAPLLQKPELTATTLSGAAAPQMAEFALTMLLALGHHLPYFAASQGKGEWPREKNERLRPVELRGSTVGMVGYGSICRELARLLQPLRVTILASKRDVMHPQDTGYMADGLGDPEGNLFHRLYPIQALRSMLKECDFVVVALPLNDKTRGLITANELAAMKPGAFLVDVGRGGIVEPGALLSALQDRKIAGAALDVFAEEPLPQNSPFWKLPNTIITPHIAGLSQFYNQRAADLFAENLKRYLSGDALLNRFDLEQGY